MALHKKQSEDKFWLYCVTIGKNLFDGALVNCLDDNERIDMVSLIKEGSIITWRHINLHGEFNFEKPVANDSFFDIGKILSLQLNRKAS